MQSCNESTKRSRTCCFYDIDDTLWCTLTTLLSSEYTRALLFHARAIKDEMVPDIPANREKGCRRMVFLFNFLFSGSGAADLGIGLILQALQTPGYPDGWGGWKP